MRLIYKTNEQVNRLTGYWKNFDVNFEKFEYIPK